MEPRKQHRRNGIIDRLEPKLRNNVDNMISNGATYQEIVDYLGGEGVKLSRTAVHTYTKKYLAAAQALRLSQEKFRIMLEEINKHPSLDTTEGIMRVLSSSILNQLLEATPEDWQGVDMDKLLSTASALVRVASQKKRTDVQVATKEDVAIEAMKDNVSALFKQRYPELARQFGEALDEIKKEFGDG